MANINNLNYESVVYWNWEDIQYYIGNELSFDYVELNEIEKVDDDIGVTLEILDKSKKEDILSCFKQYCDDERMYNEFLECVFDDSIGLLKEMVLNILTKILKAYDGRIEVTGLYAEEEGVNVRFDFKEPLVKTAIASIHRGSILKDLKDLLLKVVENVDEDYLQNKIENAIKNELNLDSVVENILTEYMKLHFSNYSLDILGISDFDKSIVSIALGC